MSTAKENFSPIRKGLLEFLVLKIISAKEVYAADILETLKTTDFATQEGTLYPLLSKMRREGLLTYVWVESQSGPPRKYYALTSKGKTELKDIGDYWRELNETIHKLGKK